MTSPPGDITQILHRAAAGDQNAAERLWPLVYDELRQIAHRELFGERRDQALSTRSLVHEAYFKLVDQSRAAWQDRGHFFAISCRDMRQILIDHARYRNAKKRVAPGGKVPLDEAFVITDDHPEDLLAMDEALKQLTDFDARLAQVVELRFYGSLTSDEIAEVLGVSARTVERDWRRAKAYLYRLLFPDQV